jgi:DNA polymerase-3 subunit chi
MTDVAFHTGVPDKLAYACRLLRKAYRSGARVVVSGPNEVLARLDKLLWVFDDLEFIPHVHLRAGTAPTAATARTPIWLVDGSPDSVKDCDVLLHLGDDVAEGTGRFGRVIEVVSAEPADREAARRRWREYEARGHALSHYGVGSS